MTYCLGILLESGFVVAGDSRTTAGVDQISTFKKLVLFEVPGERVMALLSAGNLATTQSVVSLIRQRWGDPNAQGNLAVSLTMFDAALAVGDVLREVITRDGPYVDASASLLLAGQIAGESPRLFLIYPAGNFIEATLETPFLQIGETKYGKPVLDRVVSPLMDLDTAAKLALVSMDSTVRSNLSVAPPIHLLCYRRDSFASDVQITVEANDPYMTEISQAYGAGIVRLVADLPNPGWVR
ncbi:MAG: peptidase [Geminicoccaceae bacterium]